LKIQIGQIVVDRIVAVDTFDIVADYFAGQIVVVA
jgi:hypothetical protein